MTTTLMGLSAGVLLSTAAAAALEKQAGPNLIPWPKSVKLDQGRLELTSGARIVTREPTLLPLARILADEIDRTMALKLAVAEDQPRPGDIVLTLDAKLASDEPIRALRDRKAVYTTHGAYLLTVGDTVHVAGYDYRAVAEGTSTLLQSLRKTDRGASAPRMRIKDWPHADYVGTMLDVARQDHPIAAVKQVVDLCRLYRVRYLHLHLTDDQGWTFPSTAYPQLGTKNTAAHGGIAPRVYTLPELTNLVAYADARGVTLVPELNLPGHSEAALRSFPEVFDAIHPTTGKPVNMGCMNMANEQLYGVLDTLIGEMCAVFKSSPYFHIGTDEVQLGRLQLFAGYQAFMDTHGLKSDVELATYFVRRINDLVAQRGRKAIKWEGLADAASKDIVIMTWDDKSRKAEKYLAEGFITITCPWVLGVPWEEWNMYICNGSHLKRTDAVLGSTVVMWEQSARDQVAILRGRIPQRQERTWGPDNAFTETGWGRRHNAIDALAGRLLNIASPAKWPVEIDTTLAADGLQGPELAVDDASKMIKNGGPRQDEATWFLSASAPRKGDRFDVRFREPVQALEIQVVTGLGDGTNSFQGELQVSRDGKAFQTVATLDAAGRADAALGDGTRVHTVRLACLADMSEPVAIRDIRIRQMVEISSVIANPNAAIGEGTVAVCVGDAGFNTWGKTAVSVINRGHRFVLQTGGGNALELAGFFRGTGQIDIAQGTGMPVMLSGRDPNTFSGTWRVRQGRLALAKQAGTTALAGRVIVGGGGDSDSLFWHAPNQVEDGATVELLDSPKGAARLLLNGCDDKFGTLALVAGARIVTDAGTKSGNLVLDALILDGKPLPRGIYTSGHAWIVGKGLVTVGPVRRVELSGPLPNPAVELRPDDLVVLTGAATLSVTGGNWDHPVDTGTHTLSIVNRERPLRVAGFVCGRGGMQVQADMPVEFVGPAPNAYAGPTRLTGTVRMNKASAAAVFAGAVSLDTSDGRPGQLTWLADEQFEDRTVLTVQGAGPAVLDLAGHRECIEKIVLTESARIRMGEGGKLQLRQLVVNGRPVAPGAYTAGQPWLEGNGTVVVDPRVDVAGLYIGPSSEIGAGNVANMVGNTTFGYVTRDCSIPVVNNGYTLTFDSGGGNPFHYAGQLSGTGTVVFLMGPSRTGFKDVPMRLGGEAPNTSTGPYYVRQGRVQLEKPKGVTAIAGDVTVGGQGFNDCLYWKRDEQIADTAAVTVIESPNSGAARLMLNGCTETVASLTVHGSSLVVTDGPEGQGGVLNVGALSVGGKKLPSGTYTARNQTWIEGTGQVVVR